jgi:hypothetical protein
LSEQLYNDPDWAGAMRSQDGFLVGVIDADSLNIRAEPSVESSVLGSTYRRHFVTIYDVLEGDTLETERSNEDGETEVVQDDRWFQIADDRFVSALWVRPYVPTEPPTTYQGHWVDINLTDFYAVGYEGDRAVYSAIITAGRDGRTPVGEFEILYRVFRETMDSETVGIPEDDPEYYYLENVHFTQYFRWGGFAIHENYWTSPAAFGSFSSNGCIGLLYADAEWFWHFLDVGSPVHVHY